MFAIRHQAGYRASFAPMAHGKLSLNQIKELNIEDLLQRMPIAINDPLISKEIRGKCVLVTAVAGSINSELVRQITRYNAKSIILCDQAESCLHDLQLEIEEKFGNCDVTFLFGNIQNR